MQVGWVGRALWLVFARARTVSDLALTAEPDLDMTLQDLGEQHLTGVELLEHPCSLLETEAGSRSVASELLCVMLRFPAIIARSVEGVRRLDRLRE